MRRLSPPTSPKVTRGHQDRLRPPPPAPRLRPRGRLLPAAARLLGAQAHHGLQRGAGDGLVHGILFILYLVFWADAWNRTKWSLKTAALYFALSVLPTGGFFADRKLRREAEDAVGAAFRRSRARDEDEGAVKA